MKDCVGSYKYKGYLINFHEYYQVWSIEPTFLGDSNSAINFSIEFNNNFEGFKTISETKKYIKENEINLKNEILNNFEKYKESLKNGLDSTI